MNDWQPMATAPKDGTIILLRYADDQPNPGAIEGWWFSSPKQNDDGWETIVGTIGEPSWWMPLPDDPVDS
jgi:hypothetical protein